MRTRQLSDEQVRRVLGELSGSKAHGQALDAAPIHPFAARMPLSVAEYLIGHLSGPGDLVLDPMAGSGTTLVAAQRLRRRSIGVDRDPLALLLTRTATRHFEARGLRSLQERVLQTAKQVEPLQSGPEALRRALPVEDQEFLEYWFPEESQRQLFALAAAIGTEPDEAERDLAWVVFSTLIIAKSAGASRALDLPRSRPHRNDSKPVVLPFDAWNRRFDAMRKRLLFLDGVAPPPATVLAGDARFLPADVGRVDLVLTSPPYLIAIDYLRGHKFSLLWMGYRLADLRQLRGTMVGTERGLWSLDGLPPSLEARLDDEVAVKRRRAILRRYLSDLRKVLQEVRRVLRPKGLALVVAGPAIVSAEPDAVPVVQALASDIGLEVVGSTTRHLSDGRRSLPPPAWMSDNSLKQRMQEEVIIALRR